MKHMLVLMLVNIADFHGLTFRVPTHLENLEFGLNGIEKKKIFIEKSWNFVSVIHIFFQYQNILQNLFFVICVSFLA